ncbi:dimerization domain protein, hAT family [Oesophagostomum dentatum]|uniref:Dimerization domain protein, hAT family n=1 Tax=Oesophagostomum dentatum TaxID=61180 RepID=A0A0B1S3J4_OESDE|nr:dimerization domain protein, hAT family [Oesophagostomum dentatum]
MARETGEMIANVFLDHLRDLRKWVDAPGLPYNPFQYAMQNMVALATDGASNNVGPIQGAHAHLKKTVLDATVSDETPRTDLVLSVCYAHKLNLVMKSLHHSAHNFARAIIMELHNIFGSTTRTAARRVYHETAKAMCFQPLQMNALFEVRWAESLAISLNNTVRMYPVLVASLKRLKDDNSLTSSTRRRAAIAHWVLEDARTFLALYHVRELLFTITELSKRLQKTESLLVDFILDWKSLWRKLEPSTFFSDTQDELLNRGLLLVRNSGDGKLYRADRTYLDKYVLVDGEGKTSYYASSPLLYRPRAFPDFDAGTCDTSTPEDRIDSESLLSDQQFRSSGALHASHVRMSEIKTDDPELAFQVDDSPEFDFASVGMANLATAYRNFLRNGDGDSTPDTSAQKPFAELIKELYSSIRSLLLNRFENAAVRTEVHRNTFYALDKFILLDIAEMNADFEKNFPSYVPKDTTAKGHGYPLYIRENDNAINPQMRQMLIEQSIDLLSTYCNVPGAYADFVHFYNSLNFTISSFQQWPKTIKSDRSSVTLYQIFLNNQAHFRISRKLAKIMQCVLVIPASTGDAERSFSAANRLSAGERSNMKTKTLDSLMTIQRNGPSVLTVKPESLVKQWVQPLKGLELSPRKLSSSSSGQSTLKNIQDSLQKGDLKELAELTVAREMTLQGLQQNIDAENLKQSQVSAEITKATLFNQ